MTNLAVFEFDSQEVEIVVINNVPWFNASQVAKALGYGNTSQALQDNVSTKYIQQIHLGRPGKQPNFISEPGLYQLVMRSSLPSAERFQDWVFEEVLPKIRKTGSYSVENHSRALPQSSPEERLAMSTDALLKLGVDPTNPRYAQGLRDWALNLLGVTALPASTGDRWAGVAERAEELGFGRIGADLSKRVKLGQWVSRAGLTRRREKRLCNGEDREVWLYLVCDELDEAIADFFDVT